MVKLLEVKNKSELIKYHLGNAKELSFVETLLNEQFDTIVDFMSYNTVEFEARAKLFLEKTSQYIFISSARVYAPNDDEITEECPRLLDVCSDQKYCKSDEYALAKARQEDILVKSGKRNYTIIRPSITYNNNRLQYYLGEKNEWLYRYLNGKKIVMPNDCDRIYTTMSYGNDVAKAISLMVGNKNALGELVHIAGAEAITWKEVNKIYGSVLCKYYGYAPDYAYIDTWEDLGRSLGRYYQLKYARGISRRFNNRKLESIVGRMKFESPQKGLSNCLSAFIENGYPVTCQWKTEAYFDRITGDSMRGLSRKDFIKYCFARYTPYFAIMSRGRKSF